LTFFCQARSTLCGAFAYHLSSGFEAALLNLSRTGMASAAFLFDHWHVRAHVRCDECIVHVGDRISFDSDRIMCNAETAHGACELHNGA